MQTEFSNSAAFTLNEVLVAAALSSLVLVMFLTMLVKSMGLWRESVARLQLSEHSRIARERVLHGLDGQFGLRHASRALTIYSTNQVVFSETYALASNTFTLLWPAGQPAAYSNAAGQRRLVPGGTYVERVSITNAGNSVKIDLALALTNGGRKYTQPQQIRVYLLNE